MVDVGFSVSNFAEAPITDKVVVPDVAAGVDDAVDVAINVVVNVVPNVEDCENNDVEVSLLASFSDASFSEASPSAKVVDDIQIVDGVLVSFSEVSFSEACSEVPVAASEEENVVEEVETTSG